MASDLVKVKLLERFNRYVPGDVIEVRVRDAKLLKVIGKAEDYVEPRRSASRTVTRDQTPAAPENQQPTSQATSSEATVEQQSSTEQTSETAGSENPSSRRSYFRRDMQPEE